MVYHDHVKNGNDRVEKFGRNFGKKKKLYDHNSEGQRVTGTDLNLNITLYFARCYSKFSHN